MALSMAWIRPLVCTQVVRDLYTYGVQFEVCFLLHFNPFPISRRNMENGIVLTSLVPESPYCLGQTEVLCQHCEMERPLKTDTENQKD